MAFFKRAKGTHKVATGKGKRPGKPGKSTAEAPSKKSRLAVAEGDVSSDDDDILYNDARNARIQEHSDDDYEDTQTKAYREAKELLEKIKDGEASDGDTDEENHAISHRLIKDAQTKLGILHRKIAEGAGIDREDVLIYRPHRYSPVAVAVSKDSRYIVSCSKDGSVVKYDLKEMKKVGTIRHSKEKLTDHKGTILAIAISPDSRYLVTGGIDKTIKVWNFETLEFFKDLGTHRGAVTSLVFRQHGTLEMYSGSTDRSIKAWNLDQMGYMDTMFGHQDGVLQLDMLNKPRVLSCGGQDRTLRLFKVMEDSQLVFNGFNDCISIDTAALIDDDHFVSGSADGSVSIWGAQRKKPLTVVRQAHGRNTTTHEPNWITAVAAAHNTDLVASGSSDGILRLWQISNDYKAIKQIEAYPIKGFVNALRFIDNGRRLVVAIGQEHKNGRWWKVPEAKNSIVVLSVTQASNSVA
uniref:WD_REPEATS_REGION domain-containing protein n=1 Tax=Panagrellus redivivus TaxID=6233 RepID=A0A7E4VBC5_PANRE